MKKLALSLALVASVAFVSCKDAAKEAQVEETVVETPAVEETPVVEEAPAVEVVEGAEVAPATEEAPATEAAPAN